MRKHTIDRNELKKQPYGLIDALIAHRLTSNGFDLTRRINGHTDLETNTTVYTQNSLLVDTAVNTFNFISSMFDVKGILK